MKDRVIVIFDIETTGFSVVEERIFNIGAVKHEFKNGEQTTTQYDQFMNPMKKLSSGSIRITKMEDYMLKDKPLFKDVIGGFIDFIEGADKIVAHNGLRFDIPFLNNELTRSGFADKCIDEKICIDTLQEARKRLPLLRSFSLDNLAKHFKIDIQERDELGHLALRDSLLLSHVFFELEKIIDHNTNEKLYEKCDELMDSLERKTVEKPILFG
ncbi:MAG: ribonuclease H-like domain-containing protein [Alphaproteobacteria bacterium]|nr:ribonuclease H-like domain-containing protein [Alphaproteobacteria bacterium]MBL0717978.1 ribonuclease H-like domain-containing protein [Alphaproteobacteria bacterium]